MWLLRGFYILGRKGFPVFLLNSLFLPMSFLSPEFPSNFLFTLIQGLGCNYLYIGDGMSNFRKLVKLTRSPFTLPSDRYSVCGLEETIGIIFCCLGFLPVEVFFNFFFLEDFRTRVSSATGFFSFFLLEDSPTRVSSAIFL